MKKRTTTRRLVAAGAVLSLVMVDIGASTQDSPAQTSDDGIEKLGHARTKLAKLVEVRSLISKERNEWRFAREMLEDRIELLKLEIESRRASIAEMDERHREADEQKAKLSTQFQKLEEVIETLRNKVVALEGRTKDLLRRLPVPIQTDVELLSQRLPEDPEQTEMAVSERFMSVVGILNKLNKLNGEIKRTSEVHTLPDGKTAEVNAFYLGLGQGFYVSPDGQAAAVGTATTEGWQWKPTDKSAASEIAHAIEILNGAKVAAFVRIPVWIE